MMFAKCIDLLCLVAFAFGRRRGRVMPITSREHVSSLLSSLAIDAQHAWWRDALFPNEGTLTALLLARHAKERLPRFIHRRNKVMTKASRIRSRSRPLLMSTVKSPAPDMDATSVVLAQLSALSQNDIAACFAFASPSNRKVTGPLVRFERMLRDSSAYSPLVGCSSFEILSCLTIAPGRCCCRVRVSPRDASGTSVYRWDLMKLPGPDAFKFDIGQTYVHKLYGYRGIIVGYDPTCKMDEDWISTMNVDSLPNGRNQPFYHTLVDIRDRPTGQTTYVAEENVLPDGAPDSIEHPYMSRFFECVVDGRFQPSEALLWTVQEQYPTDLRGCWLTDGVIPDSE